MSKREAEYQIHNAPMTAAEIRAANMTNNQAPQKATPAQLAQRKIREAKSSSLRRRGHGPTPAPQSIPNIQPTSDFFAGVNTSTPAFGANGVNGVQQQPPPPSFIAPSSTTFNFTAPGGTNPFANLQPSTSFSNQNPANPVGQQAPQQSSMFGQPSLPQPPSNPFTASSNFNFGKPSTVSNSFPQPQGTSMFSNTTPASTSFTFGSNQNFPQTSIFGAPTQTTGTENDISMDASADSLSKGPEKSAAPEQPAENKPATPSISGSTMFSLKSTNNEVSGNSKTPSQGMTTWMRPKNLADGQQPSTPASTLFQSSKPAESSIRTAQPTPSLGPVFNLFPKSQESEKKNNESSNAEEGAQANKPGIPFAFGAQASQKEDQEGATEQKPQDTTPFNPFRSLQTGQTGSSANQTHAESDNLQASTPFKSFQPSKSTGAENSQAAPAFNPFPSMQSSSIQKPAEKSPPATTPATNFFQTLKPSDAEESSAGKSPTKPTPSSSLSTTGNAGETLQEEKGRFSPPKPNSFTPTSILKKRSAYDKPSISPTKSSSTQESQKPGNAIEQTKPSDAGAIKKAPSQTSNLFAQSLAKVSPPATNHSNDAPHTQSQDQPRAQSPTKPTSVPEKAVAPMPEATLSKTATESVVVKVKSHGPSNVPLELDNESFVDFDKSYRLRSLNEMLKKRIAGLDPGKHDFEPIIRFYATEREAIGYPMGGLYHRVKAGDKRKTDEPDRVEEAPNPPKRARLSTSASDQQAGAPSFGFSAITTVHTTPQPATAPTEVSNSRFNPGENSSQQQPPASSNTPNVFKSMLLTNPPTFGKQGNSSLSKSSLNAQINGGNTLFPSINGAQSSFQPFQKQSRSASTPEPPKVPAAGTDSMAMFAAQAKKDAAKAKAKRKAEEYDSQEEDENDWERKTAEADRAKRAKIDSMTGSGPPSGFRPSISSASSTNGAGPAPEQDGESTRDASIEGSMRSEDRQESQADAAEKEDKRDQHYQDESQEEESDDDDIQTAMTKSHRKARNPFDSSDPKSLFNRITKPDATTESNEKRPDTSSSSIQPAKSVNPDPPGSGLFGSRPSTPSPDTPKAAGSSIFSHLGSSTPAGDNTWKPGSAIKFGAPTSAPTVNITSATPPAKTNGYTTQRPFSPFSAAAAASSALKLGGNENEDTPKASTTTFGQPSSVSQSGPGSKPFSALFGDASKKTTVNQSSAAQVGWTFGMPRQSGTSPLLAPSNVTSAITSRATSPGLTTDNDSAAESGPDDQNQDPQTDFMTSRPGEENEDVLFEVRTKALEFMSEKELVALGHSKDDAGWKSRGLGPLRVLRNSQTNRTRIVMRSEPGGNVVINSPLIDDNKYDITTSEKGAPSLKMGVWKDGKLKNWVFKIKTVQVAEELVEHLKRNEPKVLNWEGEKDDEKDGEEVGEEEDGGSGKNEDEDEESDEDGDREDNMP